MNYQGVLEFVSESFEILPSKLKKFENSLKLPGVLFSISLIIYIYVFGAKLSNKFKIPLLLILLILQVIFFKFSFYIPTVDKVVGIQRCVDFGRVWNDATNECIKQK